ncbi:MAG: hypothetical protein GYA21_12680 [Myxococcales bacterium]|nr:hypothetical protein [Myxococcales bacterium]
MKKGLLFFLPLAVAGALVALQGLLPSEQALMGWIQYQVLLLKFLSFACLLLAVSRFRPGDYLFWAWSFLALEPALLLTKDLFFEDLAQVNLAGELEAGALWTRAALTFAGNACDATGFILLLNAARRAGLAPAGRPAIRIIAIAGGITLAVLLAGPAIYSDGRVALAGSVRSLGDLFSDLGDAVSIVLVMPLLLRAWAFRGGLLIWPYAMIALAALSYLCYDIVWALGPSVWSELTVRRLDEFFRAAGLLYFCAAGISQTLIIPRRRASIP